MAATREEVYSKLHPFFEKIVDTVCNQTEGSDKEGVSPLWNAIRALDALKKANPEQIISVETPEGCLDFKIGDALIYECGYGKLVMDSE